MEIEEMLKRNDSKGRLLSKKVMAGKVEEFIRTPLKGWCVDSSMIQHILDELDELSLGELNTVIDAATSKRNEREEPRHKTRR